MILYQNFLLIMIFSFEHLTSVLKFTKGDHTLLIQIYVDEIIFGSTNPKLCKKFDKLVQDKFEMSIMSEMTFFLGLQVKQLDIDIFISQMKYTKELLKKFGWKHVLQQ